MDLGSLKKAPGSTHKHKRLGRGPGSGQGTTGGRGDKGQRSRSGSKRKAWFEGGQMPLQRRLPKFGFHRYAKVYFQVVNLRDLNKLDDKVAEVTPEVLETAGLIKNMEAPVKILGTGELKKKVDVKIHAISQSARDGIEKLGGKVTLL